MTKFYPLKLRQVCFLIIALFPITKILLLPALVSGVAKEDMWISTLINITLDFITIIFLIFACKKQDKNFFELMEYYFKGGAKVVYIVYLITFLIKAIIPIIQQKMYVDITLYEVFPNYLMFLPFFLFSAYFCVKKLTAFGRIADIVWTFTLFGFIFIFCLSITNCDFSSLLPIGANGIKNIFLGSKIGFSFFGDSVYLLFLVGNFKFEKKGTLKLILSFLASSLITLLFFVIFYTTFTFIAFRQIFALTDISRYATVINNIARFDYLAIFSILFSGIFSLILPLYFSTILAQKIFSFKNKVVPSIIVNGLIFLIIIIFNKFYFSIENAVINYLGIFIFFTTNILPIVFSFMFIKEKKYETIKN